MTTTQPQEQQPGLQQSGQLEALPSQRLEDVERRVKTLRHDVKKLRKRLKTAALIGGATSLVFSGFGAAVVTGWVQVTTTNSATHAAKNKNTAEQLESECVDGTKDRVKDYQAFGRALKHEERVIQKTRSSLVTSMPGRPALHSALSRRKIAGIVANANKPVEDLFGDLNPLPASQDPNRFRRSPDQLVTDFHTYTTDLRWLNRAVRLNTGRTYAWPTDQTPPTAVPGGIVAAQDKFEHARKRIDRDLSIVREEGNAIFNAYCQILP